MTRKEQLVAMRPRDLIALADRLGVKVAASKNRVNLKEKKMNVIERILLAEESEEIDENAISPWDEVTIYDWTWFDSFKDVTKKKVSGTTKRIPSTRNYEHTLERVIELLENIEGVTPTVFKSGVSVRVGKVKIAEFWKRSNCIRLCIKKDELDRVDTTLVTGLAQRPGKGRENQMSMYIPTANITAVITGMFS